LAVFRPHGRLFHSEGLPRTTTSKVMRIKVYAPSLAGIDKGD
jgi:hypothetical protein